MIFFKQKNTPSSVPCSVQALFFYVNLYFCKLEPIVCGILHLGNYSDGAEYSMRFLLKSVDLFHLGIVGWGQERGTWEGKSEGVCGQDVK